MIIFPLFTLLFYLFLQQSKKAILAVLVASEAKTDAFVHFRIPKWELKFEMEIWKWKVCSLSLIDNLLIYLARHPAWIHIVRISPENITAEKSNNNLFNYDLYVLICAQKSVQFSGLSRHVTSLITPPLLIIDQKIESYPSLPITCIEANVNRLMTSIYW